MCRSTWDFMSKCALFQTSFSGHPVILKKPLSWLWARSCLPKASPTLEPSLLFTTALFRRLLSFRWTPVGSDQRSMNRKGGKARSKTVVLGASALSQHTKPSNPCGRNALRANRRRWRDSREGKGDSHWFSSPAHFLLHPSNISRSRSSGSKMNSVEDKING